MSDEGDEVKGPVIGPSIPVHIAVKVNEGSKPVIGPAIPAHLLQRGEGDSTAEMATPSPPRRVMGPSMPPRQEEEEPKLSAAAQSFLDREKRMKEAVDREAAGLAPLSEEQSTNRPDWMLAPPTAQSYTETLQKDQSAALKSRGFSQAQNNRVQKGRGGGGMGGIGEEDMSLWTETPQERERRLLEEEMGIRPKASAIRHLENEEERLKRIADEEREEQLQRAIRKHNDQRGPSLLEQHQAKRRTEVKSKDKKRDKTESSSSSRRRRDLSDVESSSDGYSRKHKRREDNGREEKRHSSKKYGSQSDSETESEAEKRRERKRKSHDRNEDKIERHHKHHRSHHSDSKDRSDRDRERDQRRKEKDREKEREKDKEREKKKKRREREKEEKEEKKGAPMMVWDRESALSVGGKLMDTQKRMDTIRSASGLGSRFGSGSARYL